MERESFEDQAVADLLNQDYICIKVDREERPDLDNIYMTVTQMMTGRGGWPMTVITSPEKVPFFAGTYFPKSSMLQLLPHFARVWRDEREKAKEVGTAILKSLNELQEGRSGGDLNATHLYKCKFRLSETFDDKEGGFGSQTKFPTCHTLSFLLRMYQYTGDEKSLKMVEKTLRKIRLGGIYDQIGLGIHRYSTDAQWLLPHFEKMLYDQALFAIANLECFQVTQDSFYLDSCRDTLEYVMRDLTSPEGGFYSAEDADSEGVEGKFYLWTMQELVEVLGEKDARFFAKVYNFASDGNFLDEATRKKNGSNIPNLKHELIDQANSLGLGIDDLLKKNSHCLALLFEARENRIHPQKDDKVLTDWNGLMISAFARAARVLGDEKYFETAQKAADFCLSHLMTSNGRLLKRWRLGEAGLPGHLEDYAFLIQGLIDLYEAGGGTHYLSKAKRILDSTRKHFEDKKGGGFFLTADDGEKLLVRAKEIYDGAIPSGNSVMALNLLRMSKFTGNSDYRKSAFSLFKAFSGFLDENPNGAEVLLQGLHFALADALEIVICGKPNSEETKRMLQVINRRFIPAKVMIYRDQDSDQENLLEIAPFVKNHKMIDKQPTVYLCQNQTCLEPANELQQLIHLLEKSLENQVIFAPDAKRQ